jgi:hydrogenase nickel incorporation protein HypA/HybF
MHELSVAKNLIDLVVERLDDQQRALSVRVRIGVLNCVVPQSLRSAYRAAVVGTLLAGCRLEIETVDLIVWCPACEAERALSNPARLVCPVCQARTPKIVQGNELEVESIEVVDESAANIASP